ncbi:GGDEF domain/EAL domain-containing protein, partial [Pseudomonas syringae pv. actinidiae ICMP 19072]
TADNAAQLYEYADYALYQGKNHNPGSTCLFSASHREQLNADGVTEQALRRANLETEFHVLFQPIIESCTRETVAFEALARWNSHCAFHSDCRADRHDQRADRPFVDAGTTASIVLAVADQAVVQFVGP